MFPLPAGDLDGDGTADVVVSAIRVDAGQSRRAASLPIQLLSGAPGSGSGRPGLCLWASSARLSSPRLDRGRGHRAQSNAGRRGETGQSVRQTWARHRIRRVSTSRIACARYIGADGRVLWDIALTDQAEQGQPFYLPDPALPTSMATGSDLIAMVVESQGGKEPLHSQGGFAPPRPTAMVSLA